MQHMHNYRDGKQCCLHAVICANETGGFLQFHGFAGQHLAFGKSPCITGVTRKPSLVNNISAAGLGK
jgi:hypothetical protein